MTQLPWHAVNTGLVVTRPELPASVSATTSRVVGWGGDAARYEHFVGAGLAAGLAERDAGAIAGWRAGVLDLRDDALGRVAELGDAATAALGLDGSVAGEGSIAQFLDLQRRDAFGWPGATGEVAAIGGFSGLGGAWLSPPTAAKAVAPTSFAVTTGDLHWIVQADVCGSRILPLAAPIEIDVEASVVPTVSAQSYFVRLVRR